MTVGAYFGQVIYAPANLPGNSTTDQIALFAGPSPKGQAVQWQPVPGPTLNGATSFTSWHIDNLAQVSQNQNTSGLSFTIEPSTISSNTSTITFTFISNNYNKTAGCIVTFEGALGKRPGSLPD